MVARRTSLIGWLCLLALLLAACSGAGPAGPARSDALRASATVWPTRPASTAGHVHDADPRNMLAGRYATAIPVPAQVAPVPAATASPAPTATPLRYWDDWAEKTDDGRVIVRWLAPDEHSCGASRLESFASDFNRSQDAIELRVLMIWDMWDDKEIAAWLTEGYPIDIVGPFGIRNFSHYQQHWLPLDDLLARHEVDLSGYAPGTLHAYRDAQGQQLALPYAVFPSFIYFNKDLFAAAGLPYPPQRFGELYQGKAWDMDAMRELGMRLTLDESGRHAGEEGFDPTKIVQFGFVPQWNDSAISEGAFFGAGDLTGAHNEATIPQAWKDSWAWFYNARHVDHFVPDAAYSASDEFGRGNVWSTGKVAMAWAHLWYTCCFTKDQVPSWDMAVVPSYQGTTTSKAHMDTFVMTREAHNLDAAFEVYRYLLQSEDLRGMYGGLSPLETERSTYFYAQDEKFAPNKVTWQVALDSLAYLDTPSHAQSVPNDLKFQERYVAFDQLRHANPDLDLDAEIDRLERDLTAIFQAAGAP